MGMRNAFDSMATEGSVQLLKRILTLLKPLGVITGNGSNRLSVDINSSANLNVSQATAANLNATVTGTVTTGNQTNMGGVSAWDLMKAMSRTGYNTGVRANIT